MIKEKIIELNKKYPALFEILRFLIVGGIATVVDFLTMGIVLYIFNPKIYSHFYNVFFGATQKPSLAANMVGTGLGFVIGLIINYVLSVVFVFIDKGNSKSASGFISFAVLSAIGLAIHEIGMYVFCGKLGANEWVIKIVMTLVVLVYNYISRKLLIFKKSATAQDSTTQTATTQDINTQKENN